MHLWYVSMPFEVVCVVDGTDEEDIDEGPLPIYSILFILMSFILGKTNTR